MFVRISKSIRNDFWIHLMQVWNLLFYKTDVLEQRYRDN